MLKLNIVYNCLIYVCNKDKLSNSGENFSILITMYMHAPVISFLVALKNQISGVDPEKNGSNGFSYSPSHIIIL